MAKHGLSCRGPWRLVVPAAASAVKAKQTKNKKFLVKAGKPMKITALKGDAVVSEKLTINFEWPNL